MLLLGIDLGTSSVKVSVVDAQSQQTLCSVSYPETEAAISAPQAGWAEQSPDDWWDHVQQAILKAHAKGAYDPAAIGAIGIAYQMHGLVVVDKDGLVLRPSIIWCDSRAVPFGDRAFEALGESSCLQRLLNSPGNFTAAKLAWVKEHEPSIYARIHQVMLPGDFIAYRLTGEITTTPSALSEGIFWDFQENGLSRELLAYFGFDESIIPPIQAVFSNHGSLRRDIAHALGLRAGIPVSYKAGDQPNNALSLNVLEPGEVAATAGTSGVIYGVSGEAKADPQSRVNSFAHVNHSDQHTRIGVLLCINGTGILNSWTRKQLAGNEDYDLLNHKAAAIEPGSEGVRVIPFGNGAERMLNNRIPGAHFLNLDLNRHGQGHLLRAIQEGIAFSFRYGLDIMRANGMQPSVIRAGKNNLFLSEVFRQVFVDVTGVPVELYQNDGSAGAALGAGIGAGVYAHPKEAFTKLVSLATIHPSPDISYEPYYQEWRSLLEKFL
ncbi:carbohydrate kinase [Flavihumibacter rivuli]|uniref:xylulokinase n=1 Tax=Flavihumibacter rivuli TaxID=2838156 RepID=UPI001BDE1496|nr:FGGY family carbohydrate kinase [Flavihumibacter rivuli]ULQ54952.1 carbohydrate kinase [Flavihumibacter rivuli]